MKALSPSNKLLHKRYLPKIKHTMSYEYHPRNKRLHSSLYNRFSGSLGIWLVHIAYILVHMCALPSNLTHTRMYDACMNYFGKMLIWLKLQRAFLYTQSNALTCFSPPYQIILNYFLPISYSFILSSLLSQVIQPVPCPSPFSSFLPSLNILWSINPVGRWSSCLFYPKK